MFTVDGNHGDMVSRRVNQFVHFKWVMVELLQHDLAQKRFVTQHQKEEQTCRCAFLLSAALLSTS